MKDQEEVKRWTAKQNRPARWSRHTRNWQLIEAVALNPERIESITQKIRLAA